jgi:hypothetical protein
MSSDESTKLSKTELLSKMREHQSKYAEYSSLLKEITAAEDLKMETERQTKRLEEYKTKYTLFIQEDGAPKSIDWEEVEKLILNSIGTGKGYALGFNAYGEEGLGYTQGEYTSFSPMVEEESDVRKFLERETRRKEYQKRIKIQSK